MIWAFLFPSNRTLRIHKPRSLQAPHNLHRIHAQPNIRHQQIQNVPRVAHLGSPIVWDVADAAPLVLRYRVAFHDSLDG